jgi:hypothetical protein
MSALHPKPIRRDDILELQRIATKRYDTTRGGQRRDWFAVLELTKTLLANGTVVAIEQPAEQMPR